MIKKLNKLSSFKILIITAFVIAVLWFCKSSFLLCAEQILRLSGRMETVTLTAEDFVLSGIVPAENGGYISTDGDPQMILESQMYISGISLNSTFSVKPGEMLVYYTQKEGQGFSAAKRYWFYADENSQTSYTADFGTVKKMKSIRIDPTTFAANNMSLESVTINPPKSILSFYKISFADIFKWGCFSALISGGILLLREIFNNLKEKQ